MLTVCEREVLAAVVILAVGTAAGAATPQQVLEKVRWLGKQASVRIEAAGKIVHIDPYEIEESRHDADLVLLTHDHGDHCSAVDISRVVGKQSVIVAIPACADKLSGDYGEVRSVAPGETLELAGFQVETVPAYNVDKSHHPKASQHVGYVLTIDGVRVYHAGDTERIPEMKEFSCDIALVPLGQTYTMSSVEDAAEAVLDVKARIAIPMHYGMYEGTAADAERFKELLAGKVQVVIQP